MTVDARIAIFTTQYSTEVQKACISPPVRERASVCEKRKFPSWHVWDGWIVCRLRRLAPSVVSVRRGGRRFTLLQYELWFLCPAIMHARGEMSVGLLRWMQIPRLMCRPTESERVCCHLTPLFSNNLGGFWRSNIRSGTMQSNRPYNRGLVFKTTC